MLLFHFSHLFLLSQFQLVGDFGGDVFEGNRRPRHPLEAHAVKREAGQLAHLHLPLDEVIAGGVTGHAQQHVALAQLVLAAVGVENLPNLLYHVSGLHGRCGLHAPGEAERARLRLVFKRGRERPEMSRPQGRCRRLCFHLPALRWSSPTSLRW